MKLTGLSHISSLLDIRPVNFLSSLSLSLPLRVVHPLECAYLTIPLPQQYLAFLPLPRSACRLLHITIAIAFLVPFFPFIIPLFIFTYLLFNCLLNRYYCYFIFSFPFPTSAVCQLSIEFFAAGSVPPPPHYPRNAGGFTRPRIIFSFHFRRRNSEVQGLCTPSCRWSSQGRERKRLYKNYTPLYYPSLSHDSLPPSRLDTQLTAPREINSLYFSLESLSSSTSASPPVPLHSQSPIPSPPLYIPTNPRHQLHQVNQKRNRLTINSPIL